MNNSLIIHNDNIIDVDKYNTHIKFLNIQNTLDYIKDKEFDIIYIKDSLTSNYIEFMGLVVAYHIRLTKNLEKKRFLPIVILSNLDGFTLSKLTTKAQILLTKNTFLNQPAKIFPIFDDINYKAEFLNKITIERPKDTSGDHDIANQWAIYRWAEFLKVDSDAIKINKDKISSMLYFKYLIAKNLIEKTKGITFAPKSPTATGKILYIDDQWNKGWKDIFDKYFSKSNNIEFNTFVYTYKDKEKDVILNDLKSKIIDDSPDMVVLDLRLTQSDHEDIEIDSLTGIKILNIIKEINPGIQVIMLTATSQSIILERLYRYGILGYIKKEHPSDISISTKESFFKLKNLIDDGLENKYLKDIWDIHQKISTYSIFKKNDSDKINEIKFDINSIFEILNSKMQSANSLVIITYTKILENISSIYINEHTMKYIDNDEDVGVYDPQDNIVYDFNNEKWYKNTQNRLHNIIYEKLELKDKSIHKNLCELINCRNYLAHPNEKQPIGCNLIKNPNQQDILKWFEMLSKIIDKIDLDK